MRKTKKKHTVNQLTALLLILTLLLTPLTHAKRIEAAEPGKTILTGSGYQAIFEKTSLWDTHYTGKITICNTSDQTIHNWHLTFRLDEEITDLWNGEIKSYENKLYTIKNDHTNQDISPGESIEVGYTARNEGSLEAPSSCFMPIKKIPVEKKDYQITYKYETGWETGCTAEITIENKSGYDLEDWSLEFDFPRRSDLLGKYL